jgi:hypothetical protein
LGTVFPGFVSGVNKYLVVAARVGVVVRIHGGYFSGYAFFIEGGQRGSVTQGGVKGEKAWLGVGHDGSNMIIHPDQVGTIFICQVLCGGCYGDSDGMVGELSIHISEDGADGEWRGDNFFIYICFLPHGHVNIIVFVIVVMQCETIMAQGAGVVV